MIVGMATRMKRPSARETVLSEGATTRDRDRDRDSP